MGDDEAALLRAWRAGDSAAGEAFTRAYYGSILGFFRLRAPEVADDLAQKTFLACVEGRSHVEAGNVRAFLFGIARNLLLRHLRDRHRDLDLAHFDAGRPQSVLSPSGVIAQRHEHWLLLRALERLPDDTQLLLGLHYVQGLRSREIADVLGVTTTTVTTRLSRARDALREQVATLRAPEAARHAVLDDLEAWARSLAGLVAGEPND
ncbi:MAG: sigma-70 family RNA polymerase sigma factor [Deltaproteobacteria bacterium]|nr:sigma-70 family RNA polymerase sigma factor [Deltaproteobacteria bacterium]MBK8241368.1 sigma-70 family RNA polymerase sigma factor [Deltaproteobacteria bacterium]MBK8717084.1 sigma-70 family RNA polymerase sigma factor [Deltaproteobacteria bacterium]MBP7286393.1 sigma-70 family RNA polymerase sigma factor [Nannocystaceae bacterium]